MTENDLAIKKIKKQLSGERIKGSKLEVIKEDPKEIEEPKEEEPVKESPV